MKSVLRWHLLLTLMSVPAKVQSARILGVFPVPSLSHQIVFRSLTLELARRGHELVVLTTDPAYLHPNITEIDAHDISYPIWEETVIKKVLEDKRAGTQSMLNQYKNLMELQVGLVDAQLSLPKAKSTIFENESKHFDLILIECHLRLLYAFRRKFQVPLVGISSFSGFTYTYDAMGIPWNPIFYPDVVSFKVFNFGFFDKVHAIYCYLYKLYYDSYLMEGINKLLKKYFSEDYPSITELESQIDLLILNVNPIWDGLKVTTSNVVYMWNTHTNPFEELPLELKNYLDSSTHGVVYMSLGTNIKSSDLSEERVQIFVEAFRRLPYDVLWKWEADELPGKPDNVRIAKWLPQANLLKHPNVKAFVCQGGQQSTDEALKAEVPLVGIPFYADQEPNVQKYEKHGVGIALNINTLTADQLVEAVTVVIQDKKYRAAVRSMSRLLADGSGGVEHAASRVEYVLRHGGAQHLRSPAAGISAADYFMLDVVIVVMFAAVVAVSVFFPAVSYIFWPKMINTTIWLTKKN